MPPARHVEEHANTLLAQILCGLGIDAKAETVGHASRGRPDILIGAGRQTIVAESEYESRTGAAKDADKRLGKKETPDIIGAILPSAQTTELS